jgi:hypothetical protein
MIKAESGTVVVAVVVVVAVAELVVISVVNCKRKAAYMEAVPILGVPVYPFK